MARRRDEKRKRMTSFHYDNHPFIHPSIHLPMHLQMAGRREEKRRKRDDYFHYDNHPSIHLCIFKWPFGRREEKENTWKYLLLVTLARTKLYLHAQRKNLT